MTHEYSVLRTAQPDPAVLPWRDSAKPGLEHGRGAYTILVMDTKRGARTDKSTIARRLAEARERTRFLLAGVSVRTSQRSTIP